MFQAVVTTHQPSMTEWFEAVGTGMDTEAFRLEDNKKAERLEILHRMINLPYERPEIFEARELVDRSPIFDKILQTRSDELCGMVLIPKKPEQPKFRTRGLSIRDAYEKWFLTQSVNFDEYIVHLRPHSDALLWSATFLVNQDAIFGELVRGLHVQLTQGVSQNVVHRFRYDFQDWQWMNFDPEAQYIIERMLEKIYVPSAEQLILEKQLQSKFSHNYLMGYFEATVWPDKKIYIIDYNRLLPKLISTPPSFKSVEEKLGTILCGSVAYPGVVQGIVVIVDEQTLSSVEFPAGSILVCDNTDVRFLPLMKKAAAIITNRGGILSHAAIVVRELKKPCLIGTGDATTRLRTGDEIEVRPPLVLILKKR